MSTNKIIVEIKAAEGGDDAKLFVSDLFSAYNKFAIRHCLVVAIIDAGNSKIGYNFIKFSCSGKNAFNLFLPEAGGHRIQRIPPTETRGRRHTSTITVSVVLANDTQQNSEIDAKD